MNKFETSTREDGDDDLRQLLLELHYGLLEDDEEAELRQRIEREPETALRWRETLKVADRFAQAARVSAPPSDSEDTNRNASTTHEPNVQLNSKPRTIHANAVTSEAGDPADETRPRSKFYRWWWISLATAAGVLFAVSSVKHWRQLPDAPLTEFRMSVERAADDENGREFLVVLTPRENVTTTGGYDSSMPIVPANISFRVVHRGLVLFLGKVTADRDQPARLRIPSSIPVPEDAMLHVDAQPSGYGARTVRMRVPLEPTRCLTFLSTDKPVYRPGEAILFRSVTLNRHSFAMSNEVPIRFELFDPSDSLVKQCRLDGITERGVGNGVFELPQDAVGGTYRLVANSLDGFFPNQTLEVEVRRYRAVQLKSKLEFDRRSYTAGDTVSATLTVRRADDSVPSDAPIEASVRIDDETVFSETGNLDDQGRVELEFVLPSAIETDQGWLTVAIDDGSVIESAVRSIPIHTGKVQLDCYPEGGYLVSGLANRVYFSARNLSEEPIHVEGEVVSQAGRRVASISTVRDGMGKFEFTPESGQRYSIRIKNPEGINEAIWLPAANDSFPVMDTGVGVFAESESLTIRLRSLTRRECLVRAVCRGEVVGVESVNLEVGETVVDLPVASHAAGVIRVTVLEAGEENANPLVERLVYRRGRKELRLTVQHEGGTEKPTAYSPGDQVRLTVLATDESNDPVRGAVLGVSVVDDAALSLRRKELPSIETHFLLTSEIESPEDLEHADFYLAEGTEAEESLDLLLGTQGWRRFVSGSPQQFTESFRESLTRLLELDGYRSEDDFSVVNNESTIATQLRDYRRRAARIWNAFWRDLRVSFMILFVVWLLALLVKPKQRSVTATGLLLLGTSLALLGCGAQSTTEYASVASPRSDNSTAASDEAAAAETIAFAEESAVMEGPEMAGIAANGSENPGVVNRFARALMNAFRGDAEAESRNAAFELVQRQIDDKDLKRWRQSRSVSARELADQLLEQLRFPIRQYAHIHRKSREPATRVDFTETLFWNPIMVTDSTGTAVVEFELSDSLTSFRVRVDGHSDKGRLGHTTEMIATSIPIQVDAKLPLEVSAGDRIDLSVGVVNATKESGTFEVDLFAATPLQNDTPPVSIELAAGERDSFVVPISVAESPTAQDAVVALAAKTKVGSTVVDSVRRSLRVVPAGYPFRASRSGQISGKTIVDFEVPKGIVRESITGEFEVFPSLETELMSGLESMLREPHGCFEQTSSSNYPNVMIHQLLSAQGQLDDPLRRRIESLIRRGYRKLARYECSSLGFEWFGNDPGHEALSAFGLMQFGEMADIITVDREMMKRTRAWLVGRRDGEGGFHRNPRHLHQWSVNQDYVNAYVLWGISEADHALGQSSRTAEDFSMELDHLEELSQSTSDPYLIALSSLALHQSGRIEAAESLLAKLATAQSREGSVEGITTITQSGGISRRVETTSLAVLAWASNPRYKTNVAEALKWLRSRRLDGGFGSTQGTVLALKAMVKASSRPIKRAWELDFLVSGRRVHQMKVKRENDGKSFKTSLPQPFVDAVMNGKEVEIVSAGGEPLAFTMTVEGRTLQPQSSMDCAVGLAVALPKKTDQSGMRLGDSVGVEVMLENRTDEGLPMTLARIGLPGGLEPVIESLEDLRDSGQIDFYERRGREVSLYWRTLAPAETKKLAIRCVGEYGGSFTGPASCAYLYYTAESKDWSEPISIEIGGG
ncbi:MAG: MG2 domain-containing protein [Planctomycetota bacterium]